MAARKLSGRGLAYYTDGRGDNRVIYEGKVGSLRRFKDDASEVKQGFECGIGIAGYQDVKVGDVIEAFVVEELAGSLT